MSRSGFSNWPFMSVHTWGEAPHGDWQLEIHNEGRYMGKFNLKIKKKENINDRQCFKQITKSFDVNNNDFV